MTNEASKYFAFDGKSIKLLKDKIPTNSKDNK
jgi:hypothetical protein